MKGMGFGLYFILLLVAMGTLSMFMNFPAEEEAIAYSDVVGYFENEQVKAFVIEGTELTMQLRPAEEGKDETIVTYELPAVDIFYYDLGELIAEQRQSGVIEMQDFQVEEASLLSMFMPYIILIGLLGLFWFFMIQKQGGGAGNAMNFGKSRAKRADPSQMKVTFKDVAGANEEKADLQEVVQFLKAPQKFLSLGARIPKGVLLVGPPGTGKTLIAKAVAGEAGVPFYSISGSDFVELYVGVGASRVRDLFGEAKKSAPAIIFIDEIDAVGRHRGAGMGGGHDEREQTLNQLLVEMDGFAANLGIVMIAATNRPDILDPALLRPGRVDRQVTVTYPDVKGREAILKIHSKNKPLGPDVDLNVIARSTAGFTGADLENLMNESALLAARNGRKAITNDDIEEATIKVMVGPEKKSRKMDDREKKLTAYHESGHAVTNFFLPLLDPVHQVSIIPRGAAGGYTMSVPVEDKSYMSKKVMLENLVTLLGGRVAEALIMGDISTGASNDIERATNLAKSMVTKYGMSDKLGTVMYGSSNNEVFLGMDYGRARDYSEATAAAIDKEVYDIISEAYAEAERLLTEHKDLLHKLAQYLIVNEKIDAPEFQKLMNDPTFAPLPADFDYENSKLPEGSSYVNEVRETADASKAMSRNAVKEAMEEGASMTEAAQKAYEAIKDVPAEPVPEEVPSPVPPVDPDDDDII
ncbi:MAG: ATP-dependent zinc metalloprotease FtsH [Clostridia bacterium]|nr:ATP-dependent zinc metalloprotease FtsH [Clostridia bacterium]